MSDVTQILAKIESGDQQASEELWPLVFSELRRLAAARMANERADHTLQATALVHEAYLRLVDFKTAKKWGSRAHFFAAAAQAMRRILIDHARARATEKRGGKVVRLDFDSVEIATTATPEQLLSLDEALDELAEIDSVASQLVQLRYFAGLGLEQSAAAIGVSTATAYRHWNYARAWLYRQLLDEQAG